MAYPNQFLRLQVSGSLYTSEMWSWTLSLMPDFPGDNDGPETVPAGVISAVQTFHQATSSANAKLETIKLNEIGTDGRYTKQVTVFHDFATPVAGGQSSAPNFPPQVALAVTLRTAVRRGLASRGRFYIPAPGRLVQSDGRISAADATSTASAATALLNGLNTALPGWDPCVASRTREGDLRPVTHVSVGRVYDTIRTRRNGLLEEYVDGAALAPDA